MEQTWAIRLPRFSLWSRSGPKTEEALSGLSEFYTIIKERSKTAFLCIFLSCGFCKTYYDFIMIANDNNIKIYCFLYKKACIQAGRWVGRQVECMLIDRQTGRQKRHYVATQCTEEILRVSWVTRVLCVTMSRCVCCELFLNVGENLLTWCW